MIGLALLMIPVISAGRLLHRMEGAVLLILSMAYLWGRGSAP